MSYELIDEKLKIYSCSIKNLTEDQKEQLNSFLKSWNIKEVLQDITLFYDKDNDRIVLNSDHKLFEDYKNLIVEYMGISWNRRKMQDETLPESLKTLFNILNYIWKTRRKEEIKNILDQQDMPFDAMQDIRNIYESDKEREFSIFNIYNYGFIQGKKAERARKKKQHWGVTVC